ncbi:dihydrodipicolinate synthase family protein [Sedimentibacter hydroxybenzoicus DSM 7310]|uniref:Dihydrodipicolinate synthase family protein n=1 Tax=Sedimentibacter hydroxybenzoicus DSM 7310 TaxID=1123245 RepID=A0A974BIR5_SEDHY|nr:dihydrodipicolinate synthase family protein [Sedimentibacter hydroxybenzoicus]NYB73994.1 dihydrodipicolinate synthase family protein [Sedimentibacter hydroxybenzoicus DSM 7310]
MAFIHIRGVIPPMITPFDEKDEVDYDKFRRNIEKWNKYDLAGYLVLGSNSETVYLTEEEKLKLIELTVKHKKPGQIVFAGTGMESTGATVDLTNKAAVMGADCALIVTPFYYGGKMNDEALINFYTDVADNVKIPIMIYNVTKFTHVNISPYAVGVLCKHHNIIGMKDSSGNVSQLIDFKRAVGDAEFNLMVGTASVWYPALTLGIKAAVMALANCCPGECIDVQREFERGNIEKARELYERVFPVNSAVTGTYGIAGLKYACDLLGFEGGYVRKPLIQLKEHENTELIEILKKSKVC